MILVYSFLSSQSDRKFSNETEFALDGQIYSKYIAMHCRSNNIVSLFIWCCNEYTCLVYISKKVI